MKHLRLSQNIDKAFITVLALLVFALPSQAQTASVETVHFHSNLINETLPYNVILPPDYRQSKTTRYPVQAQVRLAIQFRPSGVNRAGASTQNRSARDTELPAAQA